MAKKPPAAFFIVGGDIIFLNPFFERIKAWLKIRTLKPAIGARDYSMALIGIKAICQFSVFYTYGVLCLITVEVNFIGTNHISDRCIDISYPGNCIGDTVILIAYFCIVSHISERAAAAFIADGAIVFYPIG